MCFELQWFELGCNVQHLKHRIEKSSNTANLSLKSRLHRLDIEVKHFANTVICPLDERYDEYCKKYLKLLSLYEKIVLSCM